MNYVATGFEPVLAELAALAATDPTYSAQVCAYHQGRRVVDAFIGPGLGPDGLVCVYSSS
jgi:hypothetical protein